MGGDESEEFARGKGFVRGRRGCFSGCLVLILDGFILVCLGDLLVCFASFGFGFGFGFRGWVVGYEGILLSYMREKHLSIFALFLD